MNAIQLLPFGDIDRGLVGFLRDGLEDVLHGSVRIGAGGFDIDRHFNEERAQYYSTEILLRLKREARDLLPADPGVSLAESKILAVVNVDLFIPILTYVFGEAEVGGNVAVVSTYRLDPRRYGLPADPDLLRERFLKEAVHELGHLYSLLHCSDPACVMHSSSYVEEIDLKGSRFCRECEFRVFG